MATTPEESEKLAEILKQIEESTAKTLENLREQHKTLSDSTKEGGKGLLAREKQKQLVEIELELTNKLIATSKEKLRAGADYKAVLDELLPAELKLLNIKKDQVTNADDLYEALDRQEKAIQKSQKSAEKLKEIFKKIKNEVVDIGNAFGFGQLSLSGLKQGTLDLLTSTDTLTKGFEKQYHLSDVYTESITSQYKAMTRLGVSMEDATKAQGAFISTVTDFTMMSRTQRDALTESALVDFRELGIAMDDTAKATQNSIKFFGASADGAIQIQNEIIATAKALGRSPQELASEFAQAGGSLAKFGNQGVKAFKDLSRISKLTGMEIQKVLNITNKFDTFEGAAEQAGQLNAALGGNFVNAMDMMMATDPAERFEMIRDALDNAGLSFDDMSYYQKQFYTESLGLADVGELAQLMSGDMDDLAGSTNATAEELIAQKESAKELMTIQEELRATMLQIANAAMPLLKIVQEIASALADNTWAVWTLLGAWAAFKSRGVFKVLIAGFSKVFEGLSSTGEVIDEVSDAIENSTAPFESFIETINKIEPKKMVAFGFAMLLIGGGVAIAAIGLAKFVAAFAGMTPEHIYAVVAALAVFGTTMVGLALAMGAATAPSLAVGGAFALMGVGVLAAAYGMSLFVAAFAGMTPDHIYAVAVALAVFGATMVGLAFAMGAATAAVPTMLGMALAFVVLGAAVGLAAIGMIGIASAMTELAAIDLAVYTSLGGLMSSIAGSSIGLLLAAGGLVFFGLALMGLGFALKSISTRDLKAIALFTSSLAEMELANMRELADLIERVATAVGRIPPGTTRIMSVMMENTAVAARSATALSQARAGAAAPAPAMTAAGGGGGSADLTVNLKLDGEILAKNVIKITQTNEGIRALEAVHGIGGATFLP